MPTLLEAAASILMEHVVSGTRLYSDSPSTWTRCQEVHKGYLIGVGGFMLAGLHFYRTHYDFDGLGLAGVRSVTRGKF